MEKQAKTQLLFFVLEKLLFALFAFGMVTLVQFLIDENRRRDIAREEMTKQLTVGNANQMVSSLRQDCFAYAGLLQEHKTAGFSGDPAALDRLAHLHDESFAYIDQITIVTPSAKPAGDALKQALGGVHARIFRNERITPDEYTKTAANVYAQHHAFSTEVNRSLIQLVTKAVEDASKPVTKTMIILLSIIGVAFVLGCVIVGVQLAKL
jgi:hypothetical protein